MNDPRRSSRKSRLLRRATCMAIGGTLLQLGGCISGLFPLALSLAESTALFALLNSIVGR